MSFTLPEKTITILKNFAQLNPSLVILPDRVEVISTHKSTIGRYIFDEPLNFENEIGIYDMSEFLSILSFYKNPTIDLHERHVVISEGNSKATYFTTAKDLIPKVLVQNKYTPDDIKKRLESIGCEIEFVLPAEKINTLQKAASIIKSEHIFFETSGNDIRITVGNELESSFNNFEITITNDIKTNKLEKPIKINVLELKFIPSDYDVMISSKGMTYWKSANNVEYFIGGQAV